MVIFRIFTGTLETAYNIDHENKILHSDSTGSGFAGSVVLFGQRQRIWHDQHLRTVKLYRTTTAAPCRLKLPQLHICAIGQVVEEETSASRAVHSS